MSLSRRVIPALLLLALLLFLSSPAALAEGVVSGPCGDSVTWTLDPDTGVVTISGTGDMFDYEYPNSSPFMYNETITAVVIEDGVTSIGYNMFYGCTQLSSVSIGADVWRICDWAFYNCSSLTSITLPASVELVERAALANCASLATIEVAPDSESLVSVDNVLFSSDMTMLIACPASRTGAYTVPEGVNYIAADAFCFCTGLTAVTLPESLSYIDIAAFDHCTALTELQIPASVYNVCDYAFSSCTGLRTVTFADGDVMIGTGAGYIDSMAFSFCDALETITLPASLQDLCNSAFYGCNALTDIYYDGSEAQWNKINGPEALERP